MFDSVAGNRRRRRSRGAVLLTLLAHVGLCAGVLSLPDGAGDPQVDLPEEIERYVEVRLAPPAPVPSPPGPHHKGRGRGSPLIPQPPPLAPVVPPVSALPGPEEVPGPGEEPGDELGGEPGGEIGGEPGGDTRGDPGGEPRVVHWSEVRPIHRVLPTFPEAAYALGLREGECIVRIDIDAAGVPTEVKSVRCPEVFQRSAVTAAMGWRFEPLPDRSPARFDLRIQYRGR